MKDPEDDERERQSAMQLKHMMGKVSTNLISENHMLKQKIKDAMTAFNEILDDLEEYESRKELISEICKEAIGKIK